MSKLSFYVSDALEAVIRCKARQANMSLSKYLAEVVKREFEIQNHWPESYIALCDDWRDEPLARPSPLR